MKVCVLQPSYEGSEFDYRHYDPPRELSRLLPEDSLHHAFLKKVSTFSQIRELKKQRFDIYVNLCEGYLDSDVPSIEVITTLEHFDLPYTGPNARLYDPPKELMKLVAGSAGVAFPEYLLAATEQDIAAASAQLAFPLFVKPHASGDSRGIDGDSLVRNVPELEKRASAVIEEYGKALIEEYVDGREFTVLVCADPDPARPPLALLPLEFRFPEGERFKTYDLKVRRHLPQCNVPCSDPALAERLKDAACKVFAGFSGAGYARLDFRLSEKDQVLFLEANFACSVFYPDGHEGSADYILRHDGMGQAGFLRRIIAEGLARHARKQKPYAVRRGLPGFGLFATRQIAGGETVFHGEGRAQRIVTRSHVERTWSPAEREVFSRYAYPLGGEVYVLWDIDPAGWAPQNHSCEPNTAFSGLDLVALRDIRSGEELTIDYATFCDERMAPFECRCGSRRCRGRIVGGKGLFGGP